MIPQPRPASPRYRKSNVLPSLARHELLRRLRLMGGATMAMMKSTSATSDQWEILGYQWDNVAAAAIFSSVGPAKSCAVPIRMSGGAGGCIGVLEPRASSTGRHLFGRDIFGLRALLHRLRRLRQVIGAMDQRHVREGLGKVANEAFGPWIIFFAEQADVVA